MMDFERDQFSFNENHNQNWALNNKVIVTCEYGNTDLPIWVLVKYM